MANNYYQATLTPESIHLSKMHATYLEMTGATCEKESDGKYYVFWEECLDEDEDNLKDKIAGALEDGDIDHKMAKALGKLSFRGVLRGILKQKRNSKITHLRIDGAWTCDKMRPGNFGGAAIIVTRTQHCDMSTGSVAYNKDTDKIEFRYCDVVDFPQK